jgi:shikimate 5-dehydrogenase
MTTANPLTGERGTRIFTFIGVTTGKSAIMRIFPAWAEHLGLGDVAMAGVDLAPHAPPERYRDAVEVIRSRPLELGALVTTHKIDLFSACRDMFDFIDPYAELCGEVSSLSKRDGLFRAHAKDPISSGRALDEFIEPGYWASGPAEGAGGRQDAAGGAGRRQGGAGPEVLLFGAGGSNLAISLHLMRGRPEGDRPSRIVVVNRSPARLESMRALHERLGGQVKVEYVHNSDPAENDRLMAEMPPGTLVVNGTGMGKDSPGSPITDQGVFPEGARVWELNYRGELDFLHQARRQEAGRALLVEDGWRYFVHGWTCVMEEVFEVPMTPAVVGELSSIALGLRST